MQTFSNFMRFHDCLMLIFQNLFLSKKIDFIASSQIEVSNKILIGLNLIVWIGKFTGKFEVFGFAKFAICLDFVK
jgi:hypothetical protein